MHQKLDSRAKALWFILITIFLLCLAILVFYVQNNNLKISADVNSSDWEFEEVAGCTGVDVKSFTIDSNNIMSLYCRNMSDVAAKAKFYTRNSSGWSSVDVLRAGGTEYYNDPNRQGISGSIVDKNNNFHLVQTMNDNMVMFNHFTYDGSNWKNESIRSDGSVLTESNRGQNPDPKGFPINSTLTNGLQVDSKKQLNVLMGSAKIVQKSGTKEKTFHYYILYKNNEGVWKIKDLPESLDYKGQDMRIQYGDFKMDNLDNIYFYTNGNYPTAADIAFYYSAEDWKPHIFKATDFNLDMEKDNLSHLSATFANELLVDSNNNAHALVRVTGKGKEEGVWIIHIYYLTNKSGAWQKELIYSEDCKSQDQMLTLSKLIGAGGLMTLDAFDNPHIAIFHETEIEYSYFNGSSWKTEISKFNKINNILDNKNMFIRKLLIDKNNISHIVYSSYSSIYHIAKKVISSQEDSINNKSDQNTLNDSGDVITDTDNSQTGNNSSTHSQSSPSTNMPSSSSASTASLSGVSKLVSTGASLWFNIFIAILFATGIGYYMFRDKIHNE